MGCWGRRGSNGSSRGSGGWLWRRRRQTWRQQRSGEVGEVARGHGFELAVVQSKAGSVEGQTRALEHQDGHGSTGGRASMAARSSGSHGGMGYTARDWACDS